MPLSGGLVAHVRPCILLHTADAQKHHLASFATQYLYSNRATDCELVGVEERLGRRVVIVCA